MVMSCSWRLLVLTQMCWVEDRMSRSVMTRPRYCLEGILKETLMLYVVGTIVSGRRYMEHSGFMVGGQAEEGGARGEGKEAASFSLAGGITTTQHLVTFWNTRQIHLHII